MDMEFTNNFYGGKCFDAYRYFGAHPLEDGWTFRVCAPNALGVELIGEFNGWHGEMMERLDEYGTYELTLPQVREGQMYKYRIHEPGGLIRDKADPYGFFAELRPGTASRTASLGDFEFHDQQFVARRNNQYGSPMSIYEVHAGSWRRGANGGWLGYRDLTEKLIDYVKENHYTHIELLPLAEHPLDSSWGYLVSGYFSATARYGTPQDLMYLIDRCHQNSVGVIMDFVPAHFVHNDYALFEFDGTPLYEYEHDEIGISQWGSCNFNFYSPVVQSFLQSAAHFWIDVFHCDGLRMDAVNNALYWQGEVQRGVNIGAVNFLRSMNEGLHSRQNGVLLIAEDSSNFPKVTAPVEYGGLGFDYKWDMGWMNDTLRYFSLPPESRPENHHLLTFSMDYFFNELYLLPLSHDEVVHGKKTILNKMWGSYEQRFAQCRALYLYMFTHPGKKLNFMGNEFGHFDEWDENKELDWDLLWYPSHDSLLRMFRELNTIYSKEPALYNREYTADCFQWLDADDRENGVYTYLRRLDDSIFVVSLNTGGRAWDAFPLGLPADWTLDEIFSTDQPYYGGVGMINPVPVAAQQVVCKKQPYFCAVKLPAFGGSIFRVLD